jgi:hypothetical protein
MTTYLDWHLENEGEGKYVIPPSLSVIEWVYHPGVHTDRIHSFQVTSDNTVGQPVPRGGFTGAVAGSNGYVTTQLTTPNGYQNGIYYGKAALNAPYDAQGYNTVRQLKCTRRSNQATMPYFRRRTRLTCRTVHGSQALH